MSTFAFELQSPIQTTVVHETEEIDDRKQIFENFIQTARKEGEIYRSRFTIPVKSREALYAIPHRNEDEAFML